MCVHYVLKGDNNLYKRLIEHVGLAFIVRKPCMRFRESICILISEEEEVKTAGWVVGSQQ